MLVFVDFALQRKQILSRWLCRGLACNHLCNSEQHSSFCCHKLRRFTPATWKNSQSFCIYIFTYCTWTHSLSRIWRIPIVRIAGFYSHCTGTRKATPLSSPSPLQPKTDDPGISTYFSRHADFMHRRKLLPSAHLQPLITIKLTGVM